MKALFKIRAFSLDALSAIRDLSAVGRELTAAIDRYNVRVSELQEDIKSIDRSVGFLYRAERYQREANGHKVNF